MHISEGVLSGPVLLSGAALAAAGTAVGLRKLDYDRIAQAGVLSAAFFVASLIHVPIGPSSVHLLLNGIVGLLLGWGAFPAILVALVLQALFFQFAQLGPSLLVHQGDEIRSNPSSSNPSPWWSSSTPTLIPGTLRTCSISPRTGNAPRNWRTTWMAGS